jgi:hypothetical protein
VQTITINVYVRLESTFLEACAMTIDRPASLDLARDSNQVVRVSVCDSSIRSFDLPTDSLNKREGGTMACSL